MGLRFLVAIAVITCGEATRKLFKDKTRIYSTSIDTDTREGGFPVFFMWYLPESGEFD